MIKEIASLLKKDLLLEWRQKYALGGILLYVVATVFIIYFVFSQENALHKVDHKIWSILFWITILFAAVNAITKSFTQESRERFLYYYSLVGPQAIILSKMIYNALLMIFLGFLCLLIFNALIGAPEGRYSIFFAALVLGGGGFSFILTMISAIAAKAENNATLMAILSFPVVIPFIIILQRFAGNTFFMFQDSSKLMQEVLVLIAFDVMLVALSYILFPYLWRD